MKKKQINLNNESHFSFRVSDKLQAYLKKLWTPPKDNSVETIVQWLYDRGLVLNYIKRLEYETIDEETIKDIILEVWLMLLEKQDKLKDLYDTQGITGLTAYVSGIIARQVHSNTSIIYNKYKRDYKRFVHLSELCWEDYYNTGEMMQTRTEYMTSETETDIMNKYIETNNNRLYE